MESGRTSRTCKSVRHAMEADDHEEFDLSLGVEEQLQHLSTIFRAKSFIKKLKKSADLRKARERLLQLNSASNFPDLELETQPLMIPEGARSRTAGNTTYDGVEEYSHPDGGEMSTHYVSCSTGRSIHKTAQGYGYHKPRPTSAMAVRDLENLAVNHHRENELNSAPAPAKYRLQPGARSTRSTRGMPRRKLTDGTPTVNGVVTTPFHHSTYGSTAGGPTLEKPPRSPKTRLQTTTADLHEFKHMIFGSWLNILLIAAIPAILSVQMEWSAVWVFILNFLVLVPLASLLGDLTECVAAHLGEAMGGMVSATFGNAVEIIVTVQALQENQIRVVQASLLGSIFSNTLLVLGCSMLASGVRTKQGIFQPMGASVPAIMLLVSGFIMVIVSVQADTMGAEHSEVLISSRVGSILMILIYGAYLVFSLRTHSEYFVGEEEEEDEELSLIGSVVGLGIATALVAIFSEFMVDSIDAFTEQSGMSKTFLGVIVLPIVGNAVEHWTAVKVAAKGKMDLAVGISLGSAAQISLFVVSVAILAGWAMGVNVTMGFPVFEVVLFVLSEIIVAFLVAQGKSNWMYGLILLGLYGFIAVGFWYEVVGEDGA